MTTDMSESIYYGTDTYNGKRCLSDDASFKYSEAQTYWNKEIVEAVNNGKSVIVFLEDYEEICIATGQRSYSGSGRNQKVTRYVAYTNNYKLIPNITNIRACNATQISLNSKYQYLKEYWERFSNQSSYKITFASESIIPILTTKTGNKTVGGILENKKSGGYLLLLPAIDFNNDIFIKKREGKAYWSTKGIEFGGSFINSIISIHKSIKTLSDKTVQPDWVNDEKYMLKNEITILSTMAEKEKNLRICRRKYKN